MNVVDVYCEEIAQSLPRSNHSRRMSRTNSITDCQIQELSPARTLVLIFNIELLSWVVVQSSVRNARRCPPAVLLVNALAGRLDPAGSQVGYFDRTRVALHLELQLLIGYRTGTGMRVDSAPWGSLHIGILNSGEVSSTYGITGKSTTRKFWQFAEPDGNRLSQDTS